MSDTVFTVLMLLLLKHFVVGFPLQNKFQYSNKGTYGHPGGVLHASLHALGTFICLVWVAPGAALVAALADGVVHYHVDWAKVNINRRMCWAPNTHEEFWWLLGLDQTLHIFTYVAIAALI